MRENASRSDTPCRRGVYEAEYLVHGRPVLNVVMSDGNRSGEFVVPPGRYEQVAALLWQLLELTDPVPQLVDRTPLRLEP